MSHVKCPNCGCIIKPQILAILIFFGIAVTARGEGDLIPTDKAAHFGISYTLQTTGYGFFKSQGYDRTDSVALSFLSTFAIGVAWELLGSTPVSRGDVLANTLGQAASIGTVFAFDF